MTPAVAAGSIRSKSQLPGAAFGVERRDWTVSGEVTLLNRRLQLWGFHPTVTGVAETRQSNQDLYDYDRLRQQLGIRRQF